MPFPAHLPSWPLEIVRLHSALAGTPEGSDRDRLRGSLWRLLFESLMRHLRVHTRHDRRVLRADLEDVAAEKALEILLRAESGAWTPAGRSAAEISGYLATAARYGWIDLIHRSSREVRMPEGTEHDPSYDESMSPDRAASSAVDWTEAHELAVAVRDCAAALSARARRVWFFRAFYEMSSREIAEHPLVGLKAPHVDVLAQRARQSLRECLRAKGHDLGDVPRGAFIELWSQLESMAEAERREVGAELGAARTP